MTLPAPVAAVQHLLPTRPDQSMVLPSLEDVWRQPMDLSRLPSLVDQHLTVLLRVQFHAGLLSFLDDPSLVCLHLQPCGKTPSLKTFMGRVEATDATAQKALEQKLQTFRTAFPRDGRSLELMVPSLPGNQPFALSRSSVDAYLQIISGGREAQEDRLDANVWLRDTMFQKRWQDVPETAVKSSRPRSRM